MNLDLAVSGGSVELAETAFAREYNEALVHQVVVALWPQVVKVHGRKRIAQRSAAVERSHGGKKVRVALVQVLRVRRFGVQAA